MPKTIANSPPVFARVGHCLLILALLGATGTHWMLLQSVAWSTMLADNLQNGSWSEAVSRTFDGKHPCQLCKAITSGKKAEQHHAFVGVKLKLEFVSESAPLLLEPPRLEMLATIPLILPRLQAEPPPVPPPRGIAS